MKQHTSSDAMVAVDWPFASNAAEIASVLSRAGLHPEYDTRPLNAVRGKGFAKTTIYVPETEGDRARRVLSDWYAERNAHVQRISSGIQRGLLLPACASIGLGLVVGLVSWDVGIGLVVAFLSFIPLVGFVHKRG